MTKYSENDIIRGKQILKNGMLAGYVRIAPGKEAFRFIGVVDKEAFKRYSQKRRPGPSSRPMTTSGATRAFNKYYEESPKYKTSRARQAAKTRDQCWDNQEMVDSEKYNRSPHLYDFEGVDDGSQCDSPRKYKDTSKLNHLIKGSQEAKEWHAKMQAAKNNKKGGGKKPVSLKTAVKLLRKYYQDKYEN